MSQRNTMDDSALALEEALTRVGGGDSEEEPYSDDPSDGDVAERPEDGDSDIEGERALMPQRVYPLSTSYNRQQRLHVVREAISPSEIPSMKTIIEDDRSFLMFRRFLKDQCITRNLNFWLACEHYRQLPPHQSNQEHLTEVGKAIYTKFIKQSAAQHVTILDRTKRSIKMCLELRSQVTPQLFATAQREIYEVMEKHEFRQFLVSDFFPDCSVFTNLDSHVSGGVYSPGMANPAYGVCGGGSLRQSGSEDSASITSFGTDCSSEAGPRSVVLGGQQVAKPYTSRNAMSDTESSRRNRPQQVGLHITKDKPVTQEEFGALLYDRLQAVQKDREAMEMKARERARKQGKSYSEIMAIEWYDLPERTKYLKFDQSTPSSRAETTSENSQLKVPTAKHTLSPSLYSPSGTPRSSSGQKAMAHINSLGLREVQDALKDLEIMNQVSKKSWSHKPSGSAYSSSVLSTTSDSGVGDTLATSDLATPPSNVHAYLKRQNLLARSMPERDRRAQAAAIALISNSPQPDELDWATQSMPPQVNRDRHRSRQGHQFVNYPHAYSSDDSSSCFTMTSKSSTSDLFIPRRLPHHFHSDSDDPHRFSHSRHYPPRRQLTTPKRSHLVQHSHKPSPGIADHAMPPQRQSEDTLVVYHLDDFPTPYAKRIGGTGITLAEFKEKVFARKGDYRYFFKSFCEDLNMEIMEEYSDDAAVLPHTQGKIMGRVEKVA